MNDRVLLYEHKLFMAIYKKVVDKYYHAYQVYSNGICLIVVYHSRL
jgi:hypothetical protein